MIIEKDRRTLNKKVGQMYEWDEFSVKDDAIVSLQGGCDTLELLEPRALNNQGQVYEWLQGINPIPTLSPMLTSTTSLTPTPALTLNLLG